MKKKIKKYAKKERKVQQENGGKKGGRGEGKKKKEGRKVGRRRLMEGSRLVSVGLLPREIVSRFTTKLRAEKLKMLNNLCTIKLNSVRMSE